MPTVVCASTPTVVTWSGPCPLAPPVIAASFSSKGDLVVAAGGREAKRWSAATWARLYTLRLPGRATSATFSRDGRLLLTTSLGGSTVWSTASGRRLATLESRPVVRGAISPSGNLVATLDRVSLPKRARVRVFDSRGGACSTSSRRRPSWKVPSSLRAVACWRRRASGARTSGTPAAAAVSALVCSTGRALRPTQSSARTASCSRSLQSDRRHPLSGTWQAERRRSSFRAIGTQRSPVAWRPDGRFIADASRDRTVFVWAVEGPESDQRVGDLVGHGDAVGAIAGAPTGARSSAGAPITLRGSGTRSSTRSCAYSEPTAGVC